MTQLVSSEKVFFFSSKIVQLVFTLWVHLLIISLVKNYSPTEKNKVFLKDIQVNILSSGGLYLTHIILKINLQSGY